MGSTNLNAPPYRMILTVVSIVVSLHILTAVAIVMVQPPLSVIEKEQPVKPIEIQLLSTPTESRKAVVDNPITEPVVVPQKTAPQSKPKLAETIKPKPVTPTKPIVKPQVNKPVEVKEAKAVKQETKTTPLPVESKTNPITSTQVAEQQAEQRANEQRQQDIAAQAHAEAVRQEKQAQAQKRATELAAAEAKRQVQEVANAKADKEAAQRDAEEQAAAQAANNTPVSFTANSASWASLPNFSFPSRAERGARSGDTFTVVLVLRVNKQGSIESVSVSKSSGNREIDRAAKQQVQQGRFKPFTKDGIARVGSVTLPISYQMP